MPVFKKNPLHRGSVRVMRTARVSVGFQIFSMDNLRRRISPGYLVDAFCLLSFLKHRKSFKQFLY